MTEEPQPKYFLISESELSQWQTVTPMSPTCQELRERVRSCQYKSSDKVLEMVSERLCTYGGSALFTGKHIAGVLDDIKKELRTKERER